MSWAGFKKVVYGLAHPPAPPHYSPDELEVQKRLSTRDYWGLPWFFQQLEPRRPTMPLKDRGTERLDDERHREAGRRDLNTRSSRE